MQEDMEAIGHKPRRVLPDVINEKKCRRDQSSRYSSEITCEPRSGASSCQEINGSDPEAIKEGDVDVIRLHGEQSGDVTDERRCSVPKGRRVDVISARAAIPVRLPLRMRPVLSQKTSVGDECTFDGAPQIEVLCPKPRSNQQNHEREYDQEVESGPGPDTRENRPHG